MTRTDYDRIVFNRLSDTGVPVARGLWGPEPPDCPRAVYMSKPSYAYADNANNACMPHYSAYLYLDQWDGALAARFEDAIKTLGTYSRRDEVDEPSGLYVVAFDLFLVSRSAA